MSKYSKELYRWTLGVILLSGLLPVPLMGSSQSHDDFNETKPLGDNPIGVNSTAYTIEFYLIDNEHYQIVNVTCKSLKNVECACSENLCRELEPCSEYLSTITLRSLEIEPIFIEKVLEARTEYAEPETLLYDVVPGPEMINISWNVTNRACVKSFQIEVISVDKQYTLTFPNDAYNQEVKGLDSCQDYQVQLTTEDVEQNNLSNRTVNVSTLYVEPENVAVKFETTNDAKVRVLWEPPKQKKCVRHYYLKWMRKDCIEFNDVRAESIDMQLEARKAQETASSTRYFPNKEESVCVWSVNITDTDTKDYVIENLQGCEEYELEIYINSNETAKNEAKDFTSPEQPPGIVMLKDVKVNTTAVSIIWNPPQAHKKCVKLYKVYIIGPLQKAPELWQASEKKTHEAMAFFKRLEPCGHYNYTIVSLSYNGTMGVPLNDTIDTTEAKPTSIRNHQVEEDAFNITISWDPPNFADLCLSGYHLIVWTDEDSPAFDKIINDTSVVVDGLHSCHWYTVQIIPTTSNLQGKLQQIEVETKAIVAEAPSNFQAIGVYPNGIELSAFETGLSNKCETLFARFTCKLSKTADVMYKYAERYVEGKIGGITFNAVLSPLSPYSEYKCNVALFNIAGWSANRSIIQRTESYYPGPPEGVLYESTNSSINFSWKTPKHANGVIKLYMSHFQLVERSFFIPPGCNAIEVEPFVQETSSLEQTFFNLRPFTRYSVQVAALNDYGVGEYTIPYLVTTEPYIPDPIINLNVAVHGPFTNAADAVFRANASLSWTIPCNSNGEIETFILEFIGERLGYGRESFKRTIKAEFNENGQVFYNEFNLKPEFNYIVTVAVKTVDVEQPGPSISTAFDAPAGVPGSFNDTVVSKIKVDAFVTSDPTTSAAIRFPITILSSESGSILYMALLLSEKNCDQEYTPKHGVLNPNQEWPDTPTWKAVQTDKNCILQYQTTPLRWRPFTSVHPQDSESIVYIIGKDNCDGYTHEYCNGPLKPDTEYNLVLRLFTKSAFNDTIVLEFKTDSLIRLTMILTSVFSCFLIGFIAGLIYLWITKRVTWQRESCHGIEDCFGDVTSKNFAIFYLDVSKPEKIQREFNELTVITMDLSYSASETGYNKNYSLDIFPYDKNRVILDIDAEGSDYINASFIDGYRRRKEYIATQGPTYKTTMDFWRMIMQHNVRVIVMLSSQESESSQDGGNIVKSEKYFPYKSKNLNVNIKKSDSYEVYDRTEMSLTHEKYGVKQKVVNLNFKKWPKHSCPMDPIQMISFLRKVKAEKIPKFSPIVVHCSDGAGQTGTFIALDIIMQRLRNESKINVYETVKKLRFQRMKMVQTLSQYTSLYSCAYELVKHKSTRNVLRAQDADGKKIRFSSDIDLDKPSAQVSNLDVQVMPTSNRLRDGLDLGTECEIYTDFNTERHEANKSL